MGITIVDARGWQNTLDLATGEKISASGPLVEMVGGVLQRHPYPGDMDPGSNRWVSDTAIDLVDRYKPRFVFLTYAAQYFAGRYTPMTGEAHSKIISDTFLEAQRFVDLTGFTAVIVGTGDMTPFRGFIDATGIDGLAVCTHWSTRYAGLYDPSPADMKLLSEHPHIEKIVSREEIVTLFGGTPSQAPRVPQFLMLAREGYAFKTAGVLMKTPVMIPSVNSAIPLHAPGHAVRDITGIRAILEEDLANRNVALIVMEGVGSNEFAWPYTPCQNGTQWCYYEPSEAQYLTISSGRHRFLDYPTGYKDFEEDDLTRLYPFSGYFKAIPKDTFGSRFAGKSISVGNKSMFMHMVAGADVSIECFARNLYNQGTMAVIHRQDKV
jgi:hypothetical protein